MGLQVTGRIYRQPGISQQAATDDRASLQAAGQPDDDRIIYKQPGEVSLQVVECVYRSGYI